MNDISRLLGTRLPIVQAPMAGVQAGALAAVDGGFRYGERGLGIGQRIGGTEHRLLLMSGTAPENRVKPEPDEQRHHGKQHDFERHAVVSKTICGPT